MRECSENGLLKDHVTVNFNRRKAKIQDRHWNDFVCVCVMMLDLLSSSFFNFLVSANSHNYCYTIDQEESSSSRVKDTSLNVLGVLSFSFLHLYW